MALRFRKSFKIAPGVRMNVSKRGIGVSAGVKGLRYSVNSRGQRRTTIGIPGTGLSHTSTSGRSYKSSAYQTKQQLVKQARELERLEAQEQARHEVAVFENRLELIRAIHRECDEAFDWQAISQYTHPYHTNAVGPHEQEALQKFEAFQPSFFQKLFKTAAKEEQQLKEAVTAAKQKDQEEFEAIDRTIRLAGRVLAKDPDAYFEVIEELAPLDDLLEFGSGFEFFIEDPEVIEVEFLVHSDEVIPKEVKSLTKTGKLSVKAMPKTKYYDLQQDYVCSCAIRIARDLFAILPFQMVVVHAMDEILDTSTGHHSTEPVLSVKFTRESFETLNFELIDPSDALANFEHRMQFRKTKGFAPVGKLPAP